MKSDPVEHIIDLTMQVGRVFRRNVWQTPRGSKGPNMHQLHALVVIREHEGITMKEFADILKISRPSATSFINRLVRLKWVRRVSDPKNRKLVRLALTQPALSMIDKKMKERHTFLAGVLSALPSVDQRELVRILERVVDVMQSPVVSR